MRQGEGSSEAVIKTEYVDEREDRRGRGGEGSEGRGEREEGIGEKGRGGEGERGKMRHKQNRKRSGEEWGDTLEVGPKTPDYSNPWCH